jgi:FKBP-type peptidyl-prolyl cis-trans isomerase FkpA
MLKAKVMLILLLIGAAFTACKKDDESAKQAEIDEQIILDYLAENEIDAIKHESGLYYNITREGAGLQPTAFSSVEVYFTGYLIDGNIFDETTQGPRVFPLPNMIPGWRIGLPLMKKGGKGLFIIPSTLGYGSDGTFAIPPNSVLIFDIDLVDVF